MMNIISFISNDKKELSSNSYIAIDNHHNCVVIDPSHDNDSLINYILKNELSCKGILLTHGHFDHIRGVDRIINKFHCDLFCDQNEVELLNDDYLNCSKLCNECVKIHTSAKELYDGEVLKLLDEDIVVIETPFHTLGSICFYFKDSKILISGDTLFKGFVGRSDLPSSAPRFFKTSIEKLLKLPDDVKIYPGHGKDSTIGFERKYNPFIK